MDGAVKKPARLPGRGIRLLIGMLILVCLLFFDGFFPFARPDHGAAAEQQTGETPEATPEPAASPAADVVALLPVSPTPTPAAAEAPAPVCTATPAPTLNPTEAEREARLEAAAEDLKNIHGPNRLSRKKIDSILEALPADLDVGRALIVLKAYSLIGQVHYEWGGKSSALGWDKKWNGVLTSTDDATGAVAIIDCGLDCSGFVRWCFINASGTSSTGRRLGSGTYKQWLNSVRIPMEDALPGDLLFTNEVGRTNHNGIVVQNDGDGTVLVIHCAAGKGVVRETAENAGFTIARRPELLHGGTNLELFRESALRHKQLDCMADLRYLLVWKNWQ